MKPGGGEMDNAYIYDTAIGRILIADNSEAITRICFENQINESDYLIIKTELQKEAISQICEYLRGKRKTFDVKTYLKGTDYQMRVWNALLKIPYGKTASYKDIAKIMGNENAARAVGCANNKNPLPIIIPCHRVIGSDGRLTGFGGGIEIKEFLLNLERQNS
jgi:methylated-DNA-[protein]-cysteine S-methyltransferase